MFRTLANCKQISKVEGDDKEARPYQVELLEKTVKQNSIVYLGTGAGKTFIATMLIKELQSDIVDYGKKTLFLVHRYDELISRVFGVMPRFYRYLEKNREINPGKNLTFEKYGKSRFTRY